MICYYIHYLQNNMVEAGRFLNISSQFFKDTCNLSGQMHLFGKQFYFLKHMILSTSSTCKTHM